MKRFNQESTQSALSALEATLPAFRLFTEEDMRKKSADELEALWKSARLVMKLAETVSVNLDTFCENAREIYNEKSRAEREARRQSRD